MASNSAQITATTYEDGRQTFQKNGAYTRLMPRISTCEYLARIGFDAMCARPITIEDRDSAESEAVALIRANQSVRQQLLAEAPEPWPDANGCDWIRPITWPDRVPGLKTWGGQQNLVGLIKARQKILRAEKPDDLMRFAAPMTGASGLDPQSCPTSLEVGFDLSLHDISVVMRPALELLAIIGLETVPLVSFGKRECGFFHGARLWKFCVEERGARYYHRWGDAQETL